MENVTRSSFKCNAISDGQRYIKGSPETTPVTKEDPFQGGLIGGVTTLGRVGWQEVLRSAALDQSGHRAR
jgi:hypothetical protein